MELILIHGGQPLTPDHARRAGWRYGARGDYTLYAPPYMLDFDWTAPPGAWSRHVDLMRQYRPVQSVVMDLECPSQIDEMKQRCQQAAALGVIPVVVPKYRGAAWAIPKVACGVEVIIGISVPTDYAAFLPRYLEAVAERKLHLLGGHPDQWRYLINYYKHSNIISIDGNAATYNARRFGKLWSRYGYYRELRGRGFDTSALIIASLRNAQRYLASGRVPSLASKRIVDCRRATGELGKQMMLPGFAVA